MEDGASYIPLDQKSLDGFQAEVDALFKEAKWQPKKIEKKPSSSVSGREIYRRPTTSSPAVEAVSIWRLAYQLNSENLVLPTGVNNVLLTLRQALKIGMYVGELYKQSSGIEQLERLNRSKELNEIQKVEFPEKQQTVSAITIFVTASYMQYELSQYKVEELSSINIPDSDIPEVCITTPIEAMQCMLFYLGKNLQKYGQMPNDLYFAKITLQYFKKIIEEIEHRRGSLKHTQSFEEKKYKLVDSDFSVAGFEINSHSVSVSAEFNSVDIDNVVGNTVAKHEFDRMVQRLFMYDFTVKKNPMKELGGLATICMFYGKPGTGKSMLDAALATEMKKMAEWLGVPHKYIPAPDDMVDPYQGVTGKKGAFWLNSIFRALNSINQGSLDDAEQILRNRSGKNISAGVLEFISVYLRHTEGASAVRAGNAVLVKFTNIPEIIDPAVMSRNERKTIIEGAKTFEDFLDLDYLSRRSLVSIDPDFVDMKLVSGYDFMSAQNVKASIKQAYEKFAESSIPDIAKLIEKASSKYDTNTHDFFAYLHVLVLEKYPLFSPRDIRNINTAVISRVMDFDLPPEWLEDPCVFYKQDYNIKLEMLKNLVKANMKKEDLSFAEIKLQETIRHLDNMATIASRQFDLSVKERVEEMRVLRAAQEILSKE